MGIVALLACLQPLVAAITLRHLAIIVPALLTMTGRVTMLGLSRWTAGQLSHRPPLFCDRAAVGGDAGAVFPDAFISVGPRIYCRR